MIQQPQIRASTLLAIFITVLPHYLGVPAFAWQGDLRTLRTEIDEAKPRVYEAKIAGNNFYALIELPPPINARDIARYGVILKLSEAQQQNLARLFEGYTESITAIMNQSQPQLDAAALEMAKQAESPAGMAPSYEQLQAVIESVRVRMRAAEEALYKSLAGTLAPSQLEAMPRVRMHRDRQHWIIHSGWVSANGVDLSELVDFACRDVAFTEAVDLLRWEYEQARTAAVQRLIHHWTDNSAANLVAVVRLRNVENLAEGQTDQKVLNAAADARTARLEITRQTFEMESQILQVNRQFLPKFLSVLPDGCKEGFRVRYLLRAYWPEFVDDPNDPAALMQAVLDRKDLSEEVRAAVQTHWQACQTRQQRITRSLCDEQDRWVDRYIESLGTKEADRPAYDLKRNELSRERLDGDVQCVKSVMSLLPPEALADLSASVEEYNVRAQRQREFLERELTRAQEMARVLKEIGD